MMVDEKEVKIEDAVEEPQGEVVINETDNKSENKEVIDRDKKFDEEWLKRIRAYPIAEEVK
jgi:Pyruvate/2-oxoacid:ferredoxin oxidoreductase gamma subunit